LQFAEDPAPRRFASTPIGTSTTRSFYTLKTTQIRETGALVYLDAARSFRQPLLGFRAGRCSAGSRANCTTDFLLNAPEDVKQALTGHLRPGSGKSFKTERYRTFEAAYHGPPLTIQVRAAHAWRGSAVPYVSTH